ncbi:MAG TPA: sugar phosphate isomerase/epimerase [Chitinophagaceae bacterium]|jgi:sugar phosphate isomerase/epimerase|nr:sugar phosphate isomerase/epimerase [Chitinophagaceae bacterium]
MNYKRREFIKIGSNLAAGLALTPVACKLMPKQEADKIKTFGIQLYTLRDVIPNDPKGVLKQVADAGYKQIESYQHDKLGMFWGMSNTEFKKYLDDLGMTIVSSHCETDKDFEKKVAESAAIGMKYLIFPHEGPGKTIDDYKRYAEDFNKKGEICKKNGLRFAFHNHEYSFLPVNGEFPEDILIQNCDPSLVDFEIDLYWVVTAKQDPEAWLKKYKNRFRLCHIKDRIKGATERDASCMLGQGSIDYSKILKTAKENGMEYFIVEQERYDNTTPLDSMKADAEYLKKLEI